MNTNDIKNKLTRSVSRGGLVLKKNAPEILLGAGLVGMVVTIVLAVKASKKVEDVAENTKAAFEAIETHDELTEQDKIKAKSGVVIGAGLRYAKAYGPAFGVGAASVFAILGSHGIMAKRQVALVAAYQLLNEGYSAYRARIVEELGAEKEDLLYRGLEESEVSEKSEDETGKKVTTKKKVIMRHGKPLSIYARCYDNSNPMYRGDRLMDRAFLVAQQRYANDLLLLHGHVFLNEVYQSLGFPHTKEGQLVGWVLQSPEQMKAEGRDGYISFGLEEPTDRATREFMDGNNDAVWLDFNVDGMVLDYI